jgi:hypothetical protein
MGREPVFALWVECTAGHGGEAVPRRFGFGTRAIAVAEVVDQWLAADHRYFKLRGEDGASYILRDDVTAGHWDLALYDRRGDMGATEAQGHQLA